jgi:large subunit ribosomal protein L28
MTRKCIITGKKRNNGYSISHSHVRTKKIQQINLQNKKIWSSTDKKWIKMRISTKAIKNLTNKMKF